MILPYVKLAQAYSNKYTKFLGKAAHAPVKCLKTRKKKKVTFALGFCSTISLSRHCFAHCNQKNPQPLKGPVPPGFLFSRRWGVAFGSMPVKNPVPITDLISTSVSTGHPQLDSPMATTQTQAGLWNASPLLCTRKILKNFPLNQWAQTGTDQVILEAAPP